ncbi:DUF1643 domain-containing protein [Kocuria oxytropis]|uniref:DUF1643 domain-containing protein n=1 Tax=Kocuria oxytropis TaxID=3058913 RepID=UPI0034D4822A
MHTMKVLGALLLNPPSTGGGRTLGHLHVAADLLGCDHIEVANLFSLPTRDVVEMNQVGKSVVGWEEARPRLGEVIEGADQLLAGWGISGITSESARYRKRQLCYIKTVASAAGHDECWTLNGEARHPSRWHQYVSDRHGRVRGESFRSKLAQVLTLVSFDRLAGPSNMRMEIVGGSLPR